MQCRKEHRGEYNRDHVLSELKLDQPWACVEWTSSWHCICTQVKAGSGTRVSPPSPRKAFIFCHCLPTTNWCCPDLAVAPCHFPPLVFPCLKKSLSHWGHKFNSFSALWSAIFQCHAKRGLEKNSIICINMHLNNRSIQKLKKCVTFQGAYTQKMQAKTISLV